MTSSSVTRSPISGTQPSRLSVSFIPRSEPSGQRRGDGVAEAAPGAERKVHGRGLVPAVDHTVPALVVAALAAVVLPLRGLDQLLERRRVTLLEEIAGPLPAEHVVGRVPPRRALVVALAHEELEEQRRLVELPAALRARQDPREQLVSALPAEEVLLVGSLRVAVARRDHHALDAEVHHGVEELARPERVGAVEERRVRRDPEAPPERRPDRFHRLVVDAVAADRLIVLLAEPVHMDAEREVLRGREDVRVELLPEEQRVARAAGEPLLDDVARHRPHLRQRNAHTCATPRRGRPRTLPGFWRVNRTVTTITAWSTPPTASSTHSRIHAVMAKLNPSTT